MNIRNIALVLISLFLFTSLLLVSCNNDSQTDVELTIDYRWPDLLEGVNYLENPIPIKGRVSGSEVEVWVYQNQD